MWLMLAFALTIFHLPVSYGYRNFEHCNGTSWIKFQGNCYLFQSTSKSRVSYYEAEDFCRSQGAHLASIHSEEENNFLLKTSEDGGFGGRLWIGLTIFSGNNTPQWSDGSPVNYQKRVNKDFYVNEKCFMLMRYQGGWRPEHCSLHYSPICKRSESAVPTPVPPPTTPQPPKGNCPSGWIRFGQKCYKYFGVSEAERKQYKQARDACWALGKDHDLVSIHSREEQNFLTQHLYEFGSSAWIGMRQVTSDEIGHDLVFGWIDNSRTDFTFWAKGHPPEGTWKYCARLSYDGVAKGEWLADYCEISNRGYICQGPLDPSVPVPKPKPSKCAANYTGYRNACYSFVSKPETQENAETTCRKTGGHLVSVVDSFEQSFLSNLIGYQAKVVWSGLKKSQGSRYLSWSDKQPLYYSNWVDGEPTLNPSKSSCVQLDVNDELKWRTSNCSLRLPYVCKTSVDSPPRFPELNGTCPSQETSWIDIGDEYCYHVGNSSNHILSWDALSRYCLTRGMKMIKAYSSHQINSLVAYFWKESYPVHLGLLRSFDKKSFVWTDGSASNFTNWDEREPSSNNECVSFVQSTGKWKAINCSEGGVAICQLPKTK